jgi:hypothetical protein
LKKRLGAQVEALEMEVVSEGREGEYVTRLFGNYCVGDNEQPMLGPIAQLRVLFLPKRQTIVFSDHFSHSYSYAVLLIDYVKNAG